MLPIPGATALPSSPVEDRARGRGLCWLFLSLQVGGLTCWPHASSALPRAHRAPAASAAPPASRPRPASAEHRLAATAVVDDDDDDDLTATELRLGKQVDAQLKELGRRTQQGPEVSRLRSILARLAKVSGRPRLPYRVAIIERPDVNAITLPGGQIYVFRGLLDQHMSEPMLAAVLAHEVVHAARSHGYRTLLSRQAAGVLTGGAGAAQLLLARGVGRTYELQADTLGVALLRKAGYDPKAMITVLSRLEQLAHERPNLLGALLGTHPPIADRLRKVRAAISER